MSVSDAVHNVFRQNGYYHDGSVVDNALQQGTGNFQGRFALTFRTSFPDAVLFYRLVALLGAFLFWSLCISY